MEGRWLRELLGIRSERRVDGPAVAGSDPVAGPVGTAEWPLVDDRQRVVTGADEPAPPVLAAQGEPGAVAPRLALLDLDIRAWPVAAG